MNFLFKKQKENKRGYATALCLSVFLLSVFAAMQVLEFSRSATATDADITLEVTVEEVISIDCGADPVTFASLTPGTPQTESSTCGVLSNANEGFDLSVKRNDASHTMQHASHASNGANIPDRTNWWISDAANASVWSNEPSTLGFRVNLTGTASAAYSSAWWGAADDDANAKFSGFPADYEIIASTSDYSATQVDVVVGYKIDVPTTQRSGAYSGDITYQATTKP